MTAPKRKIDFHKVAEAALRNSEVIVRQWLPDGRREGREWVALNPRRADQHHGSFKINLDSGKWGDFSAGISGGDLVSLAAYLGDLRQADAALNVAAMLGIDPWQ